jgi:ABC-type transport system substrate-binding protein
MKLYFLQLLAILLVGFGGQHSVASEKKAIKIQLSNSKLKPWLALQDADSIGLFNSVVHGQALNYTPDLHIKPGYIKSWDWDFKRKIFVMRMDRTKKYSNGQPISAKDFEFVLVKPFITSLPFELDAVPLSFIKGIDKLKRGQKFESGMVSGIRVVNDESIEIELTSGHNRFLYSLGGLPALGPIGEFKEDLYTFRDLPVGAGSYKVTWTDPSGSTVRVEKVSPEVEGPAAIEFYSDKSAFENGADIALGSGISRMRKYVKENPDVYTKKLGELPYAIEIMVFNFQNEAAANVNFRNAVSMAIDIDQEIEGFSAQKPSDRIIPSSAFGYHKRGRIYDVEAAKKLFAKLPTRIRNKTHKLLCHGSPTEAPGKYYEFLKSSLESIGMKVDLVISEDITIPKGNKDLAMVVYGRGIDVNPLSSFAYYLPGRSNESPSSNPEYEKAFKNAESSQSAEVQAQMIRKLSDIIEQKKIVIPLHQRYPVYYHKNNLRNFDSAINAWLLDVSKLDAVNL